MRAWYPIATVAGIALTLVATMYLLDAQSQLAARKQQRIATMRSLREELAALRKTVDLAEAAVKAVPGLEAEAKAVTKALLQLRGGTGPLVVEDLPSLREIQHVLDAIPTAHVGESSTDLLRLKVKVDELESAANAMKTAGVKRLESLERKEEELYKVVRDVQLYRRPSEIIDWPQFDGVVDPDSVECKIVGSRDFERRWFDDAQKQLCQSPPAGTAPLHRRHWELAYIYHVVASFGLLKGVPGASKRGLGYRTGNEPLSGVFFSLE